MLLVGSGQDRLLPSLSEQTRLQRLLPNAQRLILPDSGHTALLEVRPLHLLHCIVTNAVDRSSSTKWVAIQHACTANAVLWLCHFVPHMSSVDYCCMLWREFHTVKSKCVRVDKENAKEAHKILCCAVLRRAVLHCAVLCVWPLPLQHVLLRLAHVLISAAPHPVTHLSKPFSTLQPPSNHSCCEVTSCKNLHASMQT